jgi:hypothetical protein
MEMNMSSERPPEYNMYEEIIRSKMDYDVAHFEPNENNMQALKTLQKIILYYEGKVQSLDEVLTRVLKFYNEYVPYN